MKLCLYLNFLAVILLWDKSPEPSVTGYQVYWGTNSGSYQSIILVATNSVNINAPPGKVFAAVRALTPTQQSPLSAEISFTVIEVSQSIQEADDIAGPWTTRTNLGTITVVTTNQTQKFFRGLMGIKR